MNCDIIINFNGNSDAHVHNNIMIMIIIYSKTLALARMTKLNKQL